MSCDCDCFHPDKRTCAQLCLCPCTSLTVDCFRCPHEEADEELHALEATPWTRAAGTWIFADKLDAKFLILRLVFLCVDAACIVNSIVYAAVHGEGPRWMIFLTNWTNLLVLCYFISAVAITMHARMKRDASHALSKHSDRTTSAELVSGEAAATNEMLSISGDAIRATPFLRWMLPLSDLLFAIALPAMTLVVVYYWAILFDPADASSAWDLADSVAMHSVGLVLLDADYVLGLQIYFYKGITSALYFSAVFFAWTGIHDALNIKNKQGQDYIYSAFDWDNPLVLAVYSVIVLCAVVIFGCLYGCCKNVCFVHGCIEANANSGRSNRNEPV